MPPMMKCLTGPMMSEAMTTKPILFSAPMVRALLAGTKTQTRRLVKPQPDFVGNGIAAQFTSDDERLGRLGKKITCPYAVGDILWVREAFSYTRGQGLPDRGDIWYWADGNPLDGDWSKPKPSMYMPNWASRITLEVTDVRIERLQEISAEDCKAEGVKYVEDEVELYERAMPLVWHAYGRLWESIHGPGSWELNPWVWAYTFHTIEERSDD